MYSLNSHSDALLPKLVAIVSPTASGKTELGVALAVKYGGEIVSADAKQVYRGMDIGTAKEKFLPVAQHLIDIKNPEEKITVAEYQRLAYQVIDTILLQRRLPIMVGGSGLYVESVTNGYLFEEQQKSTAQQPRYSVLKMGLIFERAALKERALNRLHQRMSEGLVQEVEGLLAKGVSSEWLRACGLEYRYITEYILGERSLVDAVSKIEIATNQFIKRQYTWWRRHNDVKWVNSQEEAQDTLETFLGA